MEDNIVKRVKEELKVSSNQELAELLATSKSAIDKWSAKPENISPQNRRTIELLIENNSLKNQLEDLKKALVTISNFTK